MNLLFPRFTGFPLSLLSNWVFAFAAPEGGAAEAEPEFYTPAEDMKGMTAGSGYDPALPNVLIIGDSISIGYMSAVVAGLHGKANVARPSTNCGNTGKGMRELDDWLGDVSWSVIHFNFGLHDLCYRHPDSPVQGRRDKINGTQDVPLPDYRKNLNALVERLRLTGARLIFATTTHVPAGEAGRFVGDELDYNAVAREVMAEHGVPINDLHRRSVSFAPEMFRAAGDVHFTPAGSAELGEQVVAAITAAL